mgnify:CR=1 FL=1
MNKLDRVRLSIRFILALLTLAILHVTGVVPLW